MFHPLEACTTCSHKNVCKYAEEIENLIKKDLFPIDPDTAECIEYIPDSEENILYASHWDESKQFWEIGYHDPNESGKASIKDFEILWQLYSTIKPYVDDGYQIGFIEVNRATLNLVIEEVTKFQGESKYTKDNPPSKIAFGSAGEIPIKINNDLADKTFNLGVY